MKVRSMMAKVSAIVPLVGELYNQVDTIDGGSGHNSCNVDASDVTTNCPVA